MGSSVRAAPAPIRVAAVACEAEVFSAPVPAAVRYAARTSNSAPTQLEVQPVPEGLRARLTTKRTSAITEPIALFAERDLIRGAPLSRLTSRV